MIGPVSKRGAPSGPATTRSRARTRQRSRASSTPRIRNGFSRRAAATYELHAEQDTGHGDRQIEAIRKYATDDDTRERVRRAVRLGLEAFNFEWDGHVQAMTGERNAYWSGKTGRLQLRHPEVTLPKD